jgi:hypothetical protein
VYEYGCLLGYVLTASIIRAMIALMMKALKVSETLVNLYQSARRQNPNDRHLICLYFSSFTSRTGQSSVAPAQMPVLVSAIDR